MTTIKDICDKLTAAVQPLANTRVNDYTKFHKDVGDLVYHTLRPTPLQYGGSWDVWNEADRRKLIKLKIERRLDAGQKSLSVRGRVLTLEFVPVGCEPTDTIEKALIRVELLEKQEWHRNSLESIEKARTELNNRIAYRDALVEQAKDLEAKLEACE